MSYTQPLKLPWIKLKFLRCMCRRTVRSLHDLLLRFKLKYEKAENCQVWHERRELLLSPGNALHPSCQSLNIWSLSSFTRRICRSLTSRFLCLPLCTAFPDVVFSGLFEICITYLNISSRKLREFWIILLQHLWYFPKLVFPGIFRNFNA